MSSGHEIHSLKVGHGYTKSTSTDSTAPHLDPAQQMMVVERAGTKAGPAYLWRVDESAGRTRKACDRGYMDGADGGRAREPVKITPIGDGLARREGARAKKGKKE